MQKILEKKLGEGREEKIIMYLKKVLFSFKWRRKSLSQLIVKCLKKLPDDSKSMIGIRWKKKKNIKIRKVFKEYNFFS